MVSYNCKPSTKKSEGDINAYKGFRAYDETMRIVIAKCAIAAKKLKCHAEFERVNDLRRVVAYGVMALPALVIVKKLLQAAVCCLLKK